jgi:O-methyltransferase
MNKAEILQAVAPYTITAPETVGDLVDRAGYVVKNEIPGDFVECGVFRGGSAMAMALALMELGEKRNLWLYDTFTGMTVPTPVDIDVAGLHASDILSAVKCECGLLEVQANMASTGFGGDVVYVVGPVERRLLVPEFVPERIAILRLDTDWYESTKCELEILYPKLVHGGVLIVDDYGHWQGAKKAVDEYFGPEAISDTFFEKINYSVRVRIKP